MGVANFIRTFGNRAPRVIFCGLGGLLLVNVLALVVTARANINIGLVATGLLGALLLAYGFLFETLRGWKWLQVLVSSILILVLGLSVFLYKYGTADNATFDEDAVIVLGAALNGSRISNSLARRLDVAVDYHRRNPAAVIVVSGGQGPQESATEASLMAQYLEEHGVQAELIIQEGGSTSTVENFEFSGQLLNQKFPQGFTAAFITNDFHVYRANQIATRLGVADRHLSAGITWYLVPVTYMRETIALLHHWVLGG